MTYEIRSSADPTYTIAIGLKGAVRTGKSIEGDGQITDIGVIVTALGETEGISVELLDPGTSSREPTVIPVGGEPIPFFDDEMNRLVEAIPT